ncbi:MULTISPECIES: hypothetical protein [unclassified Streptomyces]|uniref:DUF7507 domain-containing protein n=1 Tax=unclassified Streptomyces TaxID=2593676 RepID=UPI003806AD08
MFLRGRARLVPSGPVQEVPYGLARLLSSGSARLGCLVLVAGLTLLSVVALPTGPARAGGVGDDSLRVVVTVNGRDGGGPHPPEVRAGAPVVKRYRLLNRSEAHLYEVRVLDPEVPAGAVRCPGRPLAALGRLECVARFTAAPGEHRGTVRARATVPSLRKVLTATVRTGYTGIAGALALTERVTVGALGPAPAPAAGGRAGRSAPVRRAVPTGPGRAGVRSPLRAADTAPATVTYTVANRGDRPLYAVLVTDPALGLGAAAVDCSGRPGTVPVLAPGASARCTATVRRPPGTYRSTGTAAGSDRVTTYGPDGARVPAPTLVARSAADFTVPGRQQTGPGPVRNPPGGPVGNPLRGPGGRVLPLPGAGVPVPGAAGALALPGAAVSGGAVPGPLLPALVAPGALPPPGIAAPGTASPGAGAGAAADAGAGAGAGGGGIGGAGASGGAGGAGAGAGTGGTGASGAGGGAGGVGGVGGAGASGGGGTTGTTGTTGATDTSGTSGSSATSGTTTPPSVARRAAAENEGLLARIQRRGRQAGELGIVTILLLLLIPAALAAILLGNRRS